MENPSFMFSSGPIELKEEGEDFFAEGYLSTSKLDFVNDIVTKECLLNMAEQMKSRTIKMDVEHESFRGDTNLDREINKTIIPIGKIDDFSIDEKGLKIKTILNKHSKRFGEVKNSIRDGFLDAFSIAFIPVESKTEMRDGKEVRLLHKVDLLNSAYTGNPVNTDTSMTNVFAKSLEFLREQEKAKPKKPTPQPDPHKESEDEDEEEDKTGKHPKKKKKNYKAYEKDGAHAHTKEEPLGLHNHPEIESMIRNVGEQVNDRIDFLSDRVYDSLEDSVEPRALKAKLKKEKHSHENDIIKLKEVKQMTEEEKAEEKQSESEKEESGSESEKEKSEGKAKKKLEEEEEGKKKVSKKDEGSEEEDEDESKEKSEEESKEESGSEETEKKSLKELQKDMTEVKAALKRPMLKSKIDQEDKSKNFVEEKALNPLDIIA